MRSASSPALTSDTSLSRIRGAAAAPYEVIFVDASGSPFIPLTVWYQLRGTQGPATTRQTYASCLLPILDFFLQHAIAWNADPEQLRPVIARYFTEHLHCHVQPRLTTAGALDSAHLVATAHTALAASSIRVICAALRDFYTVLIGAHLYGYPNPMTSEMRAQLQTLQRQQIANRGAPDIAGIRSEERSRGVRQQAALVTHGRAGAWRPDPLRMRDVVLAGMEADLHAMVSYTPALFIERDLATHASWSRADQRHFALLLRDRAVVLLLQYTGARVHEIAGMTVGGYRASGQGGWAMLVNKGSGGLATKAISFAATPAYYALQTYLHYGRPWLMPAAHQSDQSDQSDQSLAALPDDAPIFLTQRGTAYSTKAFEARWWYLSGAIERHCPARFTPHDIRHWFVTRYLLRTKARCKAEGTSYADAKATFARVMAWSNLHTIDTYDHSLDQLEGWADVAAFQREIATPREPVELERVAPLPEQLSAVHVIYDQDPAEEGLTADELAWLDAQIDQSARRHA